MMRPHWTRTAIWGRVVLAAVVCLLALAPRAHAESQSGEYRGINDPFGDPSNYEFSEDEREDKEFFHLGRFLMIGVEAGLGVFTGGLGSSVNPAARFGGRVLYFFDRSLALELMGGFAQHLDQVRFQGNQADLSTSLFNLNIGLRYYFDVKDAPKAIAVANPFLAITPGVYFSSATVLGTPVGLNPDVGDETGFGVAMGGGVEFNIYRRHVYLGIDLRYHLVFFPSEASTFGGVLPAGSRAGDYATAAATLNYSF